VELLGSSQTVLSLQQPRIRKGSFSSPIGAVPLLDVFVAGQENALAAECLSSDAVTHLPNRSPVLLYGPSGSGKTAIALTLVARWLNEASDRTVTITSGTDFAKAFTRAIEADDMDRFRNLHRQVDCLLIDNIQELATKPAAQEEMLITLDAIEREGRCVVATAPELATLTSQIRYALASRLHGGHTIAMALPGLDTRRELLRLLALHHQIEASDTVLAELIDQIPVGTSAVQLQGLLMRWSHHERVDPNRTPKASKRLIHQLVDSQQGRTPTLSEIAKLVSKESQVSVELLRGPSRKSSVVRARSVSMFLMRQITDESFQAIGEYFGGRDHTTVMHACKKIDEEQHTDLDLQRVLDRVRNRLG
jgi:chromosomal replication initiator protein